MERILSTEERIRRAEEIYNRRRENNVRVPTNNVNVNSRPNFNLIKKMILQILICALLYFIFYLIQNTNYIFSEDVINKTKQILSYDINFQQIYEQCMNFFTNNDSVIEDNTVQNNTTDEQNNNENAEHVSLAEPEVLSAQEVINDPPTQMEIDSNEIKSKYDPIKPISGTITSRFGEREASNPIMSTNHKGLDIGAASGTVIVSMIDAKVESAGWESTYGNYIKFKKDDLVIIYAHCKTLYVKSGEQVKKGQKVAEVGSTGNSTGPHLHVEIIKSERHVDPEFIIQI